MENEGVGSNCSDEWAAQRDCDCVGGAHGGCDPRDACYVRPRARDGWALRDDVSGGDVSDRDGRYFVSSPVCLI